MLKPPQTGIIVFGKTSSKSTLIDKYCFSFKDRYVRKFNPASISLNYFMG